MTAILPPTPSLKKISKKLHHQTTLQVLIALCSGIFFGHFFPEQGAALKVLGDSFIKLIKLSIAPVIFLTVTLGIAKMGDMRELGRVAGKAMLYFLVFSTLALIIGLLVGNIVQPGNGFHVNPETLDTQVVQGYVEKAHMTSVVGFLQNIIPSTLVGAFASGDILQVLFVSVLFGLALALSGEAGKPVLDFLQALSVPIFKLVALIMKAAPIGVFGAMAFTIGRYSISSVTTLLFFAVTAYLTSAFFIFGILGLVARYNGFSIFRLVRYLKEELFLVLGTSSSEAALPLLMEKMEAAGCKRSVVGLVIPTGYSFNLDGTNIYMTLASLFIAQALDIPLSVEDQILLVLVAMISSKGAAGIAGSGFITLAATLSVIPTIPVAGMALLLGVDRFMSDCRALTNFIGNAVATIVVARWEEALDKAQFKATLQGGQELSLHAGSSQQLSFPGEEMVLISAENGEEKEACRRNDSCEKPVVI